jgi:hypothetical protein
MFSLGCQPQESSMTFLVGLLEQVCTALQSNKIPLEQQRIKEN